MLLEAYPEAIFQRDNEGKTPADRWFEPEKFHTEYFFFNIMCSSIINH